ncbi:hypothetical protein [Paenibacillus sp. UNC217MF]|uniref:hypothetical protein n=1 Tax=Paenibacillus sp. UNC217MF TaxID=1449062 RepID=UPI00048EA48D|nr:hypothetical protein [Paenibacillus sp. UNC217MF]
MIEKVSVAWNRHVIELVLDLGYEIVYRNGYLIAEDYLVIIEHGIMWLYHVSQKDDRGFYVSNKAGIWLGQLKEKKQPMSQNS